MPSSSRDKPPSSSSVFNSDSSYNLTEIKFKPVANKNFKWHYPFTSINAEDLKEKMDIAVAVADEEPSDSELLDTNNAIDNQHLIANKAPEPSSLANTDNIKEPSVEIINESNQAATNNPVSFKTLETPPSSDDLSNIHYDELAAEGLLATDSTSIVSSDKTRNLQLPDYEATPASSHSDDKITANKDARQNNFIKDTDHHIQENKNLNPKSSNTVSSDNAIEGCDSAPESIDCIDEEKKKEKEAKLESYKQFVAEQENQVEVDYQGIRVSIEANALPSRMYFIMNALSAIIASYGLVVNSSAVVIGAMLVAMMLGPISGVALATIDYRIPFLRKSLLTVLAGGIMVIAVGFIIGYIHKDSALTNEILSRTQPTSMDLMIALAGGTAGAYAMISPHLSVAVVGVAVATALVPPLAASGILFAHGEGSLGFGALLLAITNIIAIQFTNALVLWFTGFRRLMDEDYKTHPFFAFFRRNAVPLILLVLIGGYLSYNLNNISKRQSFENEVKETINDYFIERGNALTATQFLPKEDYQMIRAVIRGESRPSPNDAKYLENVITKRKNETYPDFRPVRIQIRYMPVVVIDSSPDFNGSLDKTDAAILNREATN